MKATLALFQEKQDITKKDVEQALNISSAIATRILLQMVESGKLQRNGYGASTIYTLQT